MRKNLCNAPVIQENSYTIANINPETVDTVQKTKTVTNNNNKYLTCLTYLIINNTVMDI